MRKKRVRLDGMVTAKTVTVQRRVRRAKIVITATRSWMWLGLSKG